MDKIIKKVTTPVDIFQLEFSQSSNAERVEEVGISIGINAKTGSVGIFNDISTAAIFVGANRNLLISNRNASAWEYVTFGNASIGAGSSTNGIPVPPNGQIRVCSNDDEYVRGSTTDLHAVEIAD